MGTCRSVGRSGEAAGLEATAWGSQTAGLSVRRHSSVGKRSGMGTTAAYARSCASGVEVAKRALTCLSLFGVRRKRPWVEVLASPGSGGASARDSARAVVKLSRAQRRSRQHPHYKHAQSAPSLPRPTVPSSITRKYYIPTVPPFAHCDLR